MQTARVFGPPRPTVGWAVQVAALAHWIDLPGRLELAGGLARSGRMKKWLLLIAVLVVVALLATRGIWMGGKPAQGPLTPPPVATAGCTPAPQFADAARENARDLTDLDWAPFRVPERGWDAYAPVIARTIGTSCAPDSAGFAGALAAWQQRQGLPATGRIDAAGMEKMRVAWMLDRPFVVATRDGRCPPGAPETALVQARPEEGYWRKAVQLRPAALDAYRRMVAAARRDVPGLAADKELLTLVSGYRSPQEGAARCANGGCGGPARANCSAHQTGLAMDLNVGAAPGEDVASTSDVNRSFQAKTALYAWLVANAGRFGFVGYPYEPWHWEWTGEPVTA